MKYLLITLLLTTSLLAVSNTNVVLYNETMVNHDSYVLDNGTRNTTVHNVYNNKLRLRIYSNLTDDLFISGTGVYNANNVSEDYIKFNMVDNNFKNSEAYFESLYATYRLYSKIYLTVGLVNFSEGSYVEISELDYIKGSGLNKIINSPIEAVFLTLENSIYDWKGIAKIGYGTYDDYGIKKSSTVATDSYGTNGWYVTYDLYRNFDSIKFNYFKVDVHKDGKELIKTSVLGAGFNKYFIKQGINVFSTLGYSRNEVNTKNLVGYILTQIGPLPPLPILPPGVPVTPKPTYENKTYDGYLYSLGINKDFSSNVVESYSVGFDYTYTSQNWKTLHNNDYSDYYDNRYMTGNNYYMWFTVRLTTNIAIKTYYDRVKANKTSILSNTAGNSKLYKSIYPDVEFFDRYGVKIIFKY